MSKKKKVEVKKERVVLAEIYKESGQLGIDFPNERDVGGFELYGFLKIYLDNLEIDLSSIFEAT